MRDYRIEYHAIIYILDLYNNKENWEGILIDADFDYLLAFEYLLDILKNMIRDCKNEDDEEGEVFYSIALENTIDIYDNGIM